MKHRRPAHTVFCGRGHGCRFLAAAPGESKSPLSRQLKRLFPVRRAQKTIPGRLVGKNLSFNPCFGFAMFIPCLAFVGSVISRNVDHGAVGNPRSFFSSSEAFPPMP